MERKLYYTVNSLNENYIIEWSDWMKVVQWSEAWERNYAIKWTGWMNVML